MNSVNPMPTSGTIRVPITKPFVFTRVMYSRLMISQSLCMCGFLDEDVVERGLEQLEPADFDTGLNSGPEQLLRIGSGFQFRFHARAEAVDRGDRRMIQECVRSGKFDMSSVLAVGMLDRAQVAVQNVLAMVDQTDRVAHFLDLLHAVRGADDRRALIEHLEH